ncbi:flagellar basal body-associated protein FliL [Pseudomonas syringae]|nr:flagellar basal body-associated protein FliL [Pseudomonas syringae]MBD8574369.1 flagellar basal body-associated protein FliL [Pseudomonas syringae]MBD8788930.1 flagellar basal body-associated protein FliL [Pseudomonas syringae]MBD8800626.1 flagellar basal body-associated protein FliL [Pseudomonas syringae]MBD8812544.1 flagellar basal body-associated protein FliL [Pseudomonas syringae]
MAQSEAVKEPGSKKKLKLIIIGAVALVLAIGLSVGATWFLMHKSEPKPDPAAAAAQANAKQAAVFEAMTPAFVVNFNVNGRQRYMQVSITMLARNAADMEALKAHMPTIRNNLVLLFAGIPFDSLTAPVGMEMLRQKATASIQEVAQKELGKTVVEQLLFTNFVLQ